MRVAHSIKFAVSFDNFLLVKDFRFLFRIIMKLYPFVTVAPTLVLKETIYSFCCASNSSTLKEKITLD